MIFFINNKLILVCLVWINTQRINIQFTSINLVRFVYLHQFKILLILFVPDSILNTMIIDHVTTHHILLPQKYRQGAKNNKKDWEIIMAWVVYAKEGLVYTSATVPNQSLGHTFLQKEIKGIIWPSGLPSGALLRLSTTPLGTIIPDEQSWHPNKQCRQKALEPWDLKIDHSLSF